jgi:hypothetical protein
MSYPLSILILFLMGLASCLAGRPIKTIGIINNSTADIKIETTPIIRYNGGPEKYIYYYSADSIIWQFPGLGINAKVLQPNRWTTQDSSGLLPNYLDYSYYRDKNEKGVYIMRPFSAFEIGSTYLRGDGTITKELANENIDISSLKIFLPTGDSIVANTKNEIWNLLKRNPFLKDKKLSKTKSVYRKHELTLIIE